MKSNKKINWPGNITGSDKNVTNNHNVDKELLVDKIIQALLSIINSEASEHHGELRVW